MIEKKVESFKDMIVWQKSHELTLDIYQLSAKFPKKEQSFLTVKMREVAMVIPSNIALGFKKRSKKAKLHYYRIALTEIDQLLYYLILAEDLGYIKDTSKIVELCDVVEKHLKRLIRSNSTNQ